MRLLVADLDPSPLAANGVDDAGSEALGAALIWTGDGVEALDLLLDPLGARHRYGVASRNVLDAPRSWPEGDPTPGFAMVSPVFRATSLDHAGFDAHWRDRHAPLALRHHVGMWRYDQHVVESSAPDAPAFDGIACLYFRTYADFSERMFDDDDGRRIIMDDTRRFLDLRRSRAALMSETILRGGA